MILVSSALVIAIQEEKMESLIKIISYPLLVGLKNFINLHNPPVTIEEAPTLYEKIGDIMGVLSAVLVIAYATYTFGLIGFLFSLLAIGPLVGVITSFAWPVVICIALYFAYIKIDFF